MNFFLKFWTILGKNTTQRFWRLMLLIWTLIIGFNLAVNVGYEKEKGGLYWKPFDVSIHKNFGNSGE